MSMTKCNDCGHEHICHVGDDRDALVEEILKLWDENDGWIPGADYARLAEILRVPPTRTLTHRSGGQSKPSWAT